MGNRACNECANDNYEETLRNNIQFEPKNEMQMYDEIFEMNFDMEIDSVAEENVCANHIPVQNLEITPINNEYLLHTSPLNTQRSKVSVRSNRSNKANPQNFEFDPNLKEMQGELFRVKPLPKELYISRWCTLTSFSFSYHKSQYSSLFEERPLLEIPTSSISHISAFRDQKFYFEIHTNDFNYFNSSNLLTARTNNLFEQAAMDASNSMNKSHLMQRPRYLTPVSPKQSSSLVKTILIPVVPKNFKKNGQSVRKMKNAWTNRENQMYLCEERLLFAIDEEYEWKKWLYAFTKIMKVSVKDHN
ncbi:unnamed protein product [Blepharisma stoltei]|uniref:PH domain-containing protein n=1 Tax=Blepharisma stoltei TaxID=1481888 RepID=A0AAU9K5Q0_9CILI|nr:unnamed protein product [Blepharisma stoltei]